MFCKYCGREIKGSEKFCPNCGKNVKSEENEMTNNQNASGSSYDYANNITTNTRVIIPFSKEQVTESWTIPNDNSCEEYEMKLEYLEK